MESRNGGNVREILGVPALIVRRPQKNMYLSVRPDGMLRVSCPTGTPDAEIERFVASQSRWLHKRRAAVLQMRDERTKHDAGDTVLLWGRSLPLVVTYGRPYGASLRGETILLNLPENGTADERGKLIHSFLRARLGLAIPPLLARWQAALGVQASGWHVRDMTTRWGSCNTRTGRLCFNLRLAAKDPRCLEYVVVHELSHLIVAGHSAAFWNCVARCLPDWRQRRKLTNRGAQEAFEE
ncbi:SprT family zinc-dependent metalloprotease [Pyramidobacter piscolens]|uniref:M48 family metallopeptidase n=1 Tax=Pyramidobacter piscolens TaxID=638849 RepID=UPI0028E79853|nr:SprT family zinc-dependent metalloprotease [Pyramidobacter piscolens]